MSLNRLLERLPGMDAPARQRLRANASTWASDVDSRKQKEGAQALAAIEAYEQEERERRRQDLQGMDVSQRVIEAFRQIPLSETDQKVIQALLDHPGSASAKLSAAVGWRGNAWHMHFAEASKKRAHLLWHGPWVEERKAEFYCGILADFEDAGSRFTMKPEVVEAFAALGMKARPA